MTLWPDYLVERACAPPPPCCRVVKRSTPVVSFGNPICATVATIGINPSGSEFFDRSRNLLSGNQRRLATLPWLGIRLYGEITDRLGAKIVGECAGYFERRPYAWFRPLDHILCAGADASYYSGTICRDSACHLDLAQWATSRRWDDLDETVQEKLLEDGIPFLLQQLRQGNYRLVLANGRKVITAIEKANLTTWNRVGHLGNPSTDLYIGEGGATRFLAWSCNIQSQPGADRHIPTLARFVAKYSGGRRA